MAIDANVTASSLSLFTALAGPDKASGVVHSLIAAAAGCAPIRFGHCTVAITSRNRPSSSAGVSDTDE